MIVAKTIARVNNSVDSQPNSDVDAWRQREINIKQMQLKIAQEGNMPFVAEAIQRQLEELQAGNNGIEKEISPVSQQNDSPPKAKMDDFQALMSLLDD